MKSWTTTIQAAADCRTCLSMLDGEPSETGRRRLRTWARTHATQNPGHHVVVEVTSGLSYKSEEAAS